ERICLPAVQASDDVSVNRLPRFPKYTARDRATNCIRDAKLIEGADHQRKSKQQLGNPLIHLRRKRTVCLLGQFGPKPEISQSASKLFGRVIRMALPQASHRQPLSRSVGTLDHGQLSLWRRSPIK